MKDYKELRENEIIHQFYAHLKAHVESFSTMPMRERRFDLVSYCVGYYGAVTEDCYHAINLLAHDGLIDY